MNNHPPKFASPFQTLPTNTLSDGYTRSVWTILETASLWLNCSSVCVCVSKASELPLVMADWILLVVPIKCVALCDMSQANRMIVCPLGMMPRGLWPCYLLAATLYEECVSIPAEKRHLVSAHGALVCAGLGNGQITFSPICFLQWTVPPVHS